MTSRERVMMALNHQEPDRVPLDLGAGKSCKFSLPFYKKLLDYFGIEEDIVLCHEWAQLVYASEKVLKYFGTDVRSVLPKKIPQGEDREAKWVDEQGNKYYSTPFGTKFIMKKGNIYYDMFEYPLENSEDQEEDDKYVWPEPPIIDPPSRAAAEAFHEAGFPTVATEQYGNGFLQSGPQMYGYENWLVMLAAEPERAESFMDKLLEKKIEYWDNHFKVYGKSLDFMSENDDLGTQTGLFASPQTMRDLVIPRHKKLYDYIHKTYGAKCVLHSCGAISEIIPDLIEAGVDALNPVQVSAWGMDRAKLKKNFGKDITFWGGGCDTQKTLNTGTPQQVKDEVKEALDTFAPGGGYVFSMVHNVQADVPVENFMAMWEAYQDYCKY